VWELFVDVPNFLLGPMMDLRCSPTAHATGRVLLESEKMVVAGEVPGESSGTKMERFQNHGE
jgi:hypothetical protein